MSVQYWHLLVGGSWYSIGGTSLYNMHPVTLFCCIVALCFKQPNCILYACETVISLLVSMMKNQIGRNVRHLMGIIQSVLQGIGLGKANIVEIVWKYVAADTDG